MKCPLFIMSYMLKVGDAPTHQADCLKEECAWWDQVNSQCGFGSLVVELRYLAAFLADVRDRMPYKREI